MEKFFKVTLPLSCFILSTFLEFAAVRVHHTGGDRFYAGGLLIASFVCDMYFLYAVLRGWIFKVSE